MSYSIEFNNININITISDNNTINILCKEISTDVTLFSYDYHFNSTNSITPYVRQDNQNEDYT